MGLSSVGLHKVAGATSRILHIPAPSYRLPVFNVALTLSLSIPVLVYLDFNILNPQFFSLLRYYCIIIVGHRYF